MHKQTAASPSVLSFVLGALVLACIFLSVPTFLHPAPASNGHLRASSSLTAEQPDVMLLRSEMATSDASSAPFLGIMATAVVCLGLTSMKRQQRVSAMSGMPGQMFGKNASMPSSNVALKAQTYKDYNDPWLSSADLGFDPLNAAVGTTFDKGTSVKPETTYYNYRESEVKHGRFAMIAFLAVLMEEADRGAVLKQLGVAGSTDNLDGTLGLDEVQAPVLLLGLGAQALAEYMKQSKEDDGSFLTVEYSKDRCPGDLGFDPLGILKINPQKKIDLHNFEVNFGRLAMVGITAFLFKEFIVKDPTIAAKVL